MEKPARKGGLLTILINAKHSKAAAGLAHRAMAVMMAMQLKNHQIEVYQPR
jgi:hypothetical protein